MGRIPDEILKQIRDRVDIVDLIGRHVGLKKAGRSFKGLCPFHSEKTPSFHVNPDRQAYYCFGCHEGGNAISFAMKVENLTFPEAARALARDVGIEIPETGGAERGVSEQIFAANELAQSCYRRALAASGSPGAAYLEERGLDAETIERLGLGYAPDRWDTVVGALRAKRIPGEAGARAGLLAERQSGGHYDRLRGRVVFPIRDVRGRIVGFGGRALGADQQPKYLNTPETPVFRKREAFYGFPEALEPIRRSGRAVVVEGYFDRIALHRAGMDEAVATCGTALGADHARNLRRRTREVVLLFDGDEAGQKAMERSLEVLLPEGLRVRAAALPAGDDPDSLLAREGAEALRELVDGAPPALEVAIRRAASRGCATPWEKADAVAAVAPLLALVPSEVERAAHVASLALAVGTEARHVEAAVVRAGRGEDARDAVPVEPRRSGSDDRKLRRLARSLIDYPHLASRLSADDVALVPIGPLAELLARLVEAARSAGAVDADALAERLGDEARSLFYALVAEDFAADDQTATRTVEDTLGWLRRQRQRNAQRVVTAKLRSGDSDAATLLRRKDELRRSDQDDVPGAPPSGSAP